jgi:protein-disulfide isomerase
VAAGGEHLLQVPVSADDWRRGPDHAPVTLVEYVDYQCPHCAEISGIVDRLLDRFGDRLRVVSRHFPIASAHPHALAAAIAAEAAGAQGRFWEMHRILFKNQDALEDDDLIEYARTIGLDLDRFRADLTAGLGEDKILEQRIQGARSGVNGTPTIFVNGRRYDGERAPEALGQAVEASAPAT